MKIRDVSDILRKNDDYLILVHHSPDGDCLGSAYALAGALQLINKKARVLCDGEIPKKFDYLKKAAKEQIFDEKFVVTVDVADDRLLGNLEDKYKDKINLVIDHHEINKIKCENKYIEADSPATAEIIYLIIKELINKIPTEICDCIYTGIATDTGSFKYESVTSRTHEIAAELIRNNCHHFSISKLMFDTKSRSRLELEKRVLQNMEFYFDGKCSVTTVTKKMMEESGASDSEFDGISVIGREIEGVLVALTLKEKGENLFKVSIRSDKVINSSCLALKFDGGGHMCAAGCSIKADIDSAKKMLCDEVEKILKSKGLY